MEDTLRGVCEHWTKVLAGVLILVLMEDTLRADALADFNSENNGLNPCFNGRYSQRAG